jgi:hypothetical protein
VVADLLQAIQVITNLGVKHCGGGLQEAFSEKDDRVRVRV